MSLFRHSRRLCTVTTTTTGNTSSSPLSMSQAKSKLRSEFDPDKAVELYSSVSKQQSSRASSRFVQGTTVRRLAKSRRFADIEALLESHKSDPRITQEPYLATLIRSYGLAGMFDHAMRTFEQMDELGTPRTVVSFNALLSACISCKQFDKVPLLFNDIVSNFGVWFQPDEVSYGNVIKSYCEAGLPDKGMDVLKEMDEKGMAVSVVAYTMVLDCLYKTERREEAEKLWDEMLRNGCELDATTYNVRIMHTNLEPENVRKLIEEMKSRELKPDTVTYNHLMTSYLRLGMMDEAGKVYEDLEKNGCKPNAATFRTLIQYLCKSGCYEKGYKIFKESVKMHKLPDFGTLKHLVEGLVEKKKTKEAKGLAKTVKKKFPPHLLNSWEKIERDLGLAPKVNDANESPTLKDNGEAADEAVKSL